MLTSLSKIFEKVIFNRLYHHVNHNNILVHEEFGCRKGSSMDLASYELINNILSAVNNKLLVGRVFCDLQKASVSITVFFCPKWNFMVFLVKLTI
jgi:hypothetical protein